MSKVIYGNVAGGGAITPKSFVLEDENGTSFIGVTVGEETVLTATDNDVREGSVYAGDDGVSTGTKDIPAYYTHAGFRLVTNGSKFILPITDYDYTKLQAIICPFNTTFDNSVSAEKVVINDNVYNSLSVQSVATVFKDDTNARVDFDITNDSGQSYVIRYFMYKEIY